MFETFCAWGGELSQQSCCSDSTMSRSALAFVMLRECLTEPVVFCCVESWSVDTGLTNTPAFTNILAPIYDWLQRGCWAWACTVQVLRMLVHSAHLTPQKVEPNLEIQHRIHVGHARSRLERIDGAGRLTDGCIALCCLRYGQEEETCPTWIRSNVRRFWIDWVAHN